MTSSSDSLTSQMTPIKKVGRFILYRELGRGAIGTVYFGHDPIIDRDVAIKIFHNPPSLRDKKQHDELFMNEARAAGRLSHPNIITIFDAANEGNDNFIAMEYLQGQDLSQLLVENKPISYLTLAQILQKIAEGLDYAHNEGVIHRDIKPANIFIQENMQAKLVDFGIAHAIKHGTNETGNDKEHITIIKNNEFVGTPNYMSPEQAQAKQVGKLTDIYSLGAVMYEMLVRKKPFESPDLEALMHKIIHKKIKAPHEIDPNIPFALSRIVMKAMAKQPEKRYQSALEMARELRRFVLITKRNQKQQENHNKPSQKIGNPNTSYRRLFWLSCVAIVIAAFVALTSWLEK